MLSSIEKPKDRSVIATVCGDSGIGKEQPVDTPVITPSGERKIGDLKVGDFVIGKDGRKTKVTGVYPQGVKKVFEVKFTDGTKTFCGKNHLWSVTNKRNKYSVMTTDELIDCYKKPSGQLKYKIPLCSPVEFNKPGDSLPIDPYLLGVLIGDGYLSGNGVYFSTPDKDSFIVGKVIFKLPKDHYLNGRDTGGCNQYRINYKHKGNGLIKAVKKLSLNVKSKDKFIPVGYKLSSIDNRISLLHGLMDTDGSCVKNRTSFSTMSERLALDVCFLVESLGGLAILKRYNRESEGKGIEFKVNVKTFFNPFSLPRKASQWILKTNNRMTRFISSINETSDYAEQVCIKVDADDELYLTNNFIVTHNTSLACTFPNPIVIRAEDGLQAIPNKERPDAFPVIHKADDIWEQLTALIKENHKYQTLVIDSVTALERLFIQHIVDSDPKKPKSINQALGGYGAGLSAVGAMHHRIRKACGILNENKNMHIVFVAHADTETIELPDTDPYTRYSLRLGKKSMAAYVDDSDLVAFLKLETHTVGEEGERKKALSDGTRIAVCYATASNVSKNRYGIKDDIVVKHGENPFIKIIGAK